MLENILTNKKKIIKNRYKNNKINFNKKSNIQKNFNKLIQIYKKNTIS